MGNVPVPDAAFQLRIMREEPAALDNRLEIVNVSEVIDWRRIRKAHNESTARLNGLSGNVSHLHYRLAARPLLVVFQKPYQRLIQSCALCQPEILKHLAELGFQALRGGGVHLGGRPDLDSQTFRNSNSGSPWRQAGLHDGDTREVY